MATGDHDFFNYSLIAYFIILPLTVFPLFFITSPYGKHLRPGWGPSVPAPLAWFLMESPTLWLTLLLFPLGRHHSDPKAQILISIFLLHYFHRTIIYPLKLFFIRKTTNPFPMSIAFMAFFFNLFNSYLQSRWVSHYTDYETDNWFWLRFPIGLAVFVTGMMINVKSDYTLLDLKSDGSGNENRYKIPKGRLFEWVSCPNYLGEIMEWLGWTILTWSLTGLAFVLYTCTNLVPRAVSTHKWYLDKFKEDYPKTRKAVFPFIF